MAGKNHNTNPRHHALHLAAKLHAVHEGHADIRDEDIRVFIADDGQGDFAVRRFADQRVVALLPREGIADALADGDFIIHQHHFNHRRPPPFSPARGS